MPALAHPPLHRWDLPIEDAITLQRELAAHLVDHPLDLASVRLVAGVDVSVKDDRSHAAIALLSFPTLELVERATETIPTPFPYVPGLLTFREGAAILAAYRKLQSTPDALIFDGNGQLHPRRMGIAAHLGLWLERPTVGCAKSHFMGSYAEPGNDRGSFEPILGRKGNVLGIVLRTRAGVKPVYVSPGHLCDLDSARRLVMACTTRYRLPEPTRQAHQIAGLWDE